MRLLQPPSDQVRPVGWQELVWETGGEVRTLGVGISLGRGSYLSKTLRQGRMFSALNSHSTSLQIMMAASIPQYIYWHGQRWYEMSGDCSYSCPPSCMEFVNWCLFFITSHYPYLPTVLRRALAVQCADSLLLAGVTSREHSDLTILRYRHTVLWEAASQKHLV